MKVLKSISFAVLALSLITAFAFRPIDKKTSKRLTANYFVLSDPSTNPAVPNNYEAFNLVDIAPTESDCPAGTDVVCVIYTAERDAIATTKPDVDNTGSGKIGERINQVLTTPALSGLESSGADIVWLQVEP